MKVQKLEDSNKLTLLAHHWCQESVQETKATSLYLPAGGTPVSLYHLWEETRPNFLKFLTFHQVDDVLNGPSKGIFKQFFQHHLPSYQEQFIWVDKDSMSVDLAILGLGTNGHVAFHEPEYQSHLFKACVQLSDQTCENLKMPLGSWGITYGAAAFNQCKKILLFAQGHSKKPVIQKLLDGEKGLPASHLLDHPDLSLYYCD